MCVSLPCNKLDQVFFFFGDNANKRSSKADFIIAPGIETRHGTIERKGFDFNHDDPFLIYVRSRQ